MLVTTGNKLTYLHCLSPGPGFKRRISHVPNVMQMRKIYCLLSFALDSATCEMRRLKPALANQKK